MTRLLLTCCCVLAAGAPARANLTYQFHGDKPGASGILETDIVPNGPGPITIRASDIEFVFAKPPGNFSPPRAANLSNLSFGTLTTTDDLSSILSGRVEFLYGGHNGRHHGKHQAEAEIGAWMYVDARGITYHDDNPHFSFRIKGTWVRSDVLSMPEPSTVLSALAGVFMVGFCRWRRRAV